MARARIHHICAQRYSRGDKHFRRIRACTQFAAEITAPAPNIIANADGIYVIVCALDGCSKAEVQEQGIRALSKLAVYDENKIAICYAGGINAIISAMFKYPSFAEIQEHGCMALWMLASDDRMKIAIVSDDGFDAIVAAMKNHASNAKVQEKGCGALWMLAANHDKKSINSNAACINAIVSAIRNYPAIAALQKWEGRVLISDFTGMSESELAALRLEYPLEERRKCSPARGSETPLGKKQTFGNEVVVMRGYDKDNNLLSAKVEVHRYGFYQATS